MNTQATTQSSTMATAGHQDETTRLLERCDTEQVTPVARAFVLGLAHLIGADGAHAFLQDLDTRRMTLNEAVAAIHEHWMRQHHDHRPLKSQPHRRTRLRDAAAGLASQAGVRGDDGQAG